MKARNAPGHVNDDLKLPKKKRGLMMTQLYATRMLVHEYW